MHFPSVHGISNAHLNTPWPKVEHGKAELQRYLNKAPPQPDELIDLMLSEDRYPESALPDTGVGAETERLLSPMYIRSEDYGTRSTTAVLYGADGDVELVERTHGEGEDDCVTQRFSYSVNVEAEAV